MKTVSLALVIAACSSQLPEAPPELGRLTVSVRSDGDWPGWCGGAWSGPREIATAAHCSGPELYAVAYGDVIVRGREVRRDTDRDLALYATDREAPAWTQHRWPDRLERLTMVLGARALRTAVRQRATAWGQVDLDFQAIPGMSGAPAFTDDGELACILVARYVDPDYGTACAVLP